MAVSTMKPSSSTSCLCKNDRQELRALCMCAEDPMVSWHPTPLFQHPPPSMEQESNQKDNEMSFLNDFFCFVLGYFVIFLLFSSYWCFLLSLLPPLSSLSPFPTWKRSASFCEMFKKLRPLLSSAPDRCHRCFFFNLFLGLWSHQ